MTPNYDHESDSAPPRARETMSDMEKRELNKWLEGGTSCAYFDTDPDNPEIVSQSPHNAKDSLSFYVPLPNGDAVRVHVCERHGEQLVSLYPEFQDDKSFQEEGE